MSANWACACSTRARAAAIFFSCAFAALIARSASLGETVLRFSKSCCRCASAFKNSNCALCASTSCCAVLICAAARERRACNSDASSCTIGSPAFRVSPSHAKIFSTRPPEREATWTSSTSIVPETALLWRRQPGRRATAQTAMANEKRIRSWATLCARNRRKGNGWLLENAPGPKAWDQGRDESRRVRCAGPVPAMARAVARRSFFHEQGERRIEVRASLRKPTPHPGERIETASWDSRRRRRSLDFVAEEIVRSGNRHYRGCDSRSLPAARLRGCESLRCRRNVVRPEVDGPSREPEGSLIGQLAGRR